MNGNRQMCCSVGCAQRWALQTCRFSALTALTALRLDRNGSLAELPAATLSGLRHLSLLSLEGCRSLGALGPGAAELPLAWLNVKVRRRLWCFFGGGGADRGFEHVGEAAMRAGSDMRPFLVLRNSPAFML